MWVTPASAPDDGPPPRRRSGSRSCARDSRPQRRPSFLSERHIAPPLKPASLGDDERYQAQRAQAKQRMLDAYRSAPAQEEQGPGLGQRSSDRPTSSADPRTCPSWGEATA